MASPKNKPAKPLQTEGSGDPELDILIRLANLIPPGVTLPTYPDLKCIQLEEDWEFEASMERQFPRFLDEYFPREKFSEFRVFMDDGFNDPIRRPYAMYDYLQEVHQALRMIATQQRSVVDSGLRFPWQSVGTWKIDRIRICESCKRLFFATRNNRMTHTEACANALRVRKFRQKQKQYEQARKLKSAKGTHAHHGGEQSLKGGSNGTKKTR